MEPEMEPKKENIKEIFYEDIMYDFENMKLRNCLINLVDYYTIIVIKGLNSNQRHQIYSKIYYPLKFEKIKENDYYKDDNDNDNDNDDKDDNDKDDKDNYITSIKIYNYKIKENYKILNDEYKPDNDSWSEPSINTIPEEQLEKLENIAGQQLNNIYTIDNKTDSCIRKLNLVIAFNVIGWILLIFLDPVRLEVSQKMECY
jgi:hypothetical protein